MVNLVRLEHRLCVSEFALDSVKMEYDLKNSLQKVMSMTQKNMITY